ncbi:MAG TPA: oligosaccharide flippase family protein [Longimicrobium sp.]
MSGRGTAGRALWRRARGSALVHNTVALYFVQFAGYLLPLATVPYLTRVLRPGAWGVLVFSQAFAAWLAIVLHYGFAFSATRMVARGRGDAREVARIVSAVQGAKLLLLTGVAAASALAFVLVPLFRREPRYLVWGLAAAVLQGFLPMWYFQGVERMRGIAALDVLTRLGAAAGVFVLVRTPQDGWRVLALQAGAALLSAAAATAWMYREVPFRAGSPREWTAALRDGWPLFVFCGAASAYTTANSFTLGLFAGPHAAGFYGSAEKLVRAASNLLLPVSQALYPRINHLVVHDRPAAAALVRRSLGPIVGLGVAAGASIALAAPLLTRVLFGPGYEPVTGVLRILAFLPPILALGTVLGLNWILPLGRDRAYVRFVLAAGAANLLLAALLAPRYGAAGMAVAAVLAEAVVEAGLCWLVLRPSSGELGLRG